MSERYGRVPVKDIRAAFDDLRAAINAGDMFAAQAALDRYEPWAGYIFDLRHKEPKE